VRSNGTAPHGAGKQPRGRPRPRDFVGPDEWIVARTYTGETPPGRLQFACYAQPVAGPNNQRLHAMRAIPSFASAAILTACTSSPIALRDMGSFLIQDWLAKQGLVRWSCVVRSAQATV